jgi:Fe-S oxidoreductase
LEVKNELMSNSKRINTSSNFSFRKELDDIVLDEMNMCIGCNQCMDVCPVSKSPDLTISLLNDAVIHDKEPKGIVKEFALNCVQCGKCVPVCPPGVRRDLMVLLTKSKIKSYPGNYDSYVRLKNPHPSIAGKSLYAVKKRMYKKSLGNLFDKLDTDELKEAELLFYPGCYVFDEVCHKTVAIMEYLKDDYEILAGYSNCCGWPQYLQGRLEMADEFLEILWNRIQIVKPKRIITTCAECYAALRKLKAIKQADFIPLTTTEYFYENRAKLPLVKSEKTFGFHDSCHISRKFRNYETPRKLMAELGNLVELKDHHDKCACCYYYNFGNDSKNNENRKQRMKEVKEVADVMMTDCITCYEVYHDAKGDDDLEIFEFNELVYECIKKKDMNYCHDIKDGTNNSRIDDLKCDVDEPDVKSDVRDDSEEAK